MKKENNYYNETINNIVKKLEVANIAYRQGTPIMTDKEFDEMEDTLKIGAPNHPYFSKIGLTPEENIQKVKLPIKMGSMNKCSSLEEIKSWIKFKKIPQDTSLILTGKYDGCSLVVNENKENEAFTRGDGFFGQNVSTHYKYFNQPYFYKDCYSIGEAIINKHIFEEKYGKKSIGKYNYANPRNLIPGLLNPLSIPNKEILKDVSYIRYGILSKNGEDNLNKIDQLAICNSINPIKVNFLEIKLKDITEELLNYLYNQWSKNYELDGIIIDINDSELRNKLGVESNNNPCYARAYKSGFEEIKETKIERIEWQMGQSGKLCPVCYMKPIILEGATCTKITLYNARYVEINNIKIGQRILVKRSGGVIGKIVEFLNE